MMLIKFMRANSLIKRFCCSCLCIFIWVACEEGKTNTREAGSVVTRDNKIDQNRELWKVEIEQGRWIVSYCDTLGILLQFNGSSGFGENDGSLLINSPIDCNEMLLNRIVLIDSSSVRQVPIVQLTDSLFLISLQGDYNRGLLGLLKVSVNRLELIKIADNEEVINSDFGFFMINLKEKVIISTSRIDLNSVNRSYASIPMHVYRYFNDSLRYAKTVMIPDSAFQPAIQGFELVSDSSYVGLYSTVLDLI